MSRSINFVAERQKKLTAHQLQDIKLLKISLWVLSGVFITFLITLAVRFYFVFEVKDLTAEQNRMRDNILSRQSVEQEYVIFAQKLKHLSGFFEKRKDKQEILIFFESLFGSDVIVSGIDYSSADSDIVLLTIKTPNVFVMEKAFETLSSESVVERYQNITKSNMRRSATGNYTVDLAVVLSETAIAAQPAAE